MKSYCNRKVSRARLGKGVAFGTGNPERREYDLNGDSAKVKNKQQQKDKLAVFHPALISEI